MLELFDGEILELIPHRPPMLLINRLLSVSAEASLAQVIIDSQASFYVAGKGVPAWIGLEYMGQTAALIAGYQQKTGLTEPHLGFLMGSRKYKSYVSWFEPSVLQVECQQLAIVGESLANFNCQIKETSTGKLLVEGSLSVFRKKRDV